MLQASNVTFRIGDKALVSDVSLTFPPGQLHLIIAPNGAGKSTLIKVLARLLRPQTGKVEYAGEDVEGTSEADLARRRAVLSQAVEVAFPLTVREVVMMGRYPHFGGRPGLVDRPVRGGPAHRGPLDQVDGDQAEQPQGGPSRRRLRDRA